MKTFVDISDSIKANNKLSRKNEAKETASQSYTRTTILVAPSEMLIK